MSREKIHELNVGELVRSVRELKGYSLTEMGFHLGVSEAAVRHYEAGRREPEAEFLKRLAEMAPAEMRREIERRLPDRLRGLISIRVVGRRYNEDTLASAHSALDLIFDNAPSEVIKKIQALLDKHAEQWRNE